MKFYNAKIRINGSLMHEVIRQRLTAPEVLLINAIHGGSAIVSLSESGSKAFAPRDHRLERRRLEDKYGQGGQKQKHLDLIRGLFGPVAGALPETVSMEDVAPLPEEVEDLDAPLPDAPVAKEPESTDPKDAVKASIDALGGSYPKNASLTKLREILGNLQLEQGRKAPDDEDDESDVPVIISGSPEDPATSVL